jgi:hypothetical protein
MARPPIKPVEGKLRVVLAVLRGEVSIKEAARRPSRPSAASSKLECWSRIGGSSTTPSDPTAPSAI